MVRTDRIRQYAKSFFPEIQAIRRNIHRKPELSFEEYQTSAYIKEILDSWGITYKDGIVKTGILASIEGGKAGKKIALRADMDALPINEKTGLDFSSENPGIMHACRHDVHTSTLLGAIKILNEIKSELKGTLYFIFQPGEERVPGGARLMLEEGIFDNNPPDYIIAQHVFPELDAGEIGLRPGPYMASSDEIFISLKGKGGHGAIPEQLVDPVLMAAQVLIALQQLSSRNSKPGTPTVLSFGKVIADGAVNVIPDEVKLEGTFRTMDENWRKKAHAIIVEITENIARSFGGKAEVEIRHGYPVLENNPELSKSARQLAMEYLGGDKVTDLDIRMTAEDFAYFAGAYPGLLYRLGIRTPGGETTQLHTPRFKVDESAIETGMGFMAFLAASLLEDQLFRTSKNNNEG